MSRDDLADLLRETAREPTEPLDAPLLVQRAARQRRRNHALASVGVLCVVFLGIAGAVPTRAPDVAFSPSDEGGKADANAQALADACVAGRPYLRATRESQLADRVTPEDDAAIAESLRAFSEAALRSGHDGLIAATREMAAADEEARAALSTGQVPDSDAVAAALQRGTAARDAAIRICREEAGVDLE